ncbi:steroidogenic acute regulatory protein-like isoform X2 [Aethina tumida]|uniref:steroidogenic acute regulatory protein-like isoform X2 n=1 Tax=Aethina tumida TaxID=116153 RepID=UPI0021498419|nr:steroidogenic acute regulatory protein-like isoform X2 [Aethina tumida]
MDTLSFYTAADNQPYQRNYQHENVQSPLDISHSNSINTIHSINREYISQNLIAGQRVNGRMSNIRRFFCLFVTFDFLFTGLMWIICVMLKGEYIITALSEQIYHYNMHTSLFDIVLVAFFRFTVLLFFYAILYINHWIVIALSTALTCAALIAKVFVYDFAHSSQPVFEVLIVLTSFVLAWGEAWFLDFRVIPQEEDASRYIIKSERAPLIRNYIRGLPSLYTESVHNFYSPLVTPDGSLYRYDHQQRNVPTARFSREEEEKYKLQAAKTLQDAWDLLHKKDWKLEKEQDGDRVESRMDKGVKIFKLNAQINVSPKYLLDDLYYKVHQFPQWNPAIVESQKIQAIDEYTDICYQISADAAGGVVKSRDFVTLRHWAQVEDCFVIANVKTDHPSFPVNDKYVRGETGVGCSVMQTITNEPNKCNYKWILNTNLKLSLVPRQLIEKEMIKMMFKYVKDLREHLKTEVV